MVEILSHKKAYNTCEGFREPQGLCGTRGGPVSGLQSFRSTGGDDTLVRGGPTPAGLRPPPRSRNPAGRRGLIGPAPSLAPPLLGFRVLAPPPAASSTLPLALSSLYLAPRPQAPPVPRSMSSRTLSSLTFIRPWEEPSASLGRFLPLPGSLPRPGSTQ